jgi:hypothetical protein
MDQVTSVPPLSAIVPGGEGEALAQVAGQPPDARREITLLIANGHHYVNLENTHGCEDGRPRSVAAEARLWTRYERSDPRPCRRA